MELVRLDSGDARWAALAAGQPEATIFHHPAWLALLQECYGYRPVLLASLGGDGQAVAALPLMQIDSRLTGRRLVSLPFSDFCPPLVTDGVSLRDLAEGLQSWRRQAGWPEICVHWPLPEAEGVCPAEPVARHITHLDPDSERVFRGFARTQVQQRIRKAEREGVDVRMSQSWEDVRLFYGLHLETRRRLGTPIQPLRFFRLLWARLISQGLGFVLLAYHPPRLLAGAVFLHTNETLTYKYSASDPAFWKLRPNNLILWHAIRWGCEHGYRVFDWGKTELDNAGLREFKLGWGSEEWIAPYSFLADRPPKAARGGTSRRLLTVLIQRSPAWVCRGIGELLYRHFA